MADIPIELIREILSYVPTVPLLRFRSVCKAWRSLIDGDDDFIKLHLQHQCGSEYLFFETGDDSLYALPLNSLNFCENGSISVEAIPLQMPPGKSVLSVFGFPSLCCDGLILQCDDNEIWTLVNPFTREYKVLPHSHNVTNRKRKISKFGLGYDVVTDDYKVVMFSRFYYKNGYLSETMVYSLKSNCWRRIDYSPNCDFFGPGLFVNGALHWITYDWQQQEKELLIAFDLGTETYHQHSLPSAICELGEGSPAKYLHDLGGCLFLRSYCIGEGKRLDLWKMHEYKGKYTWTKFFSFDYMVDARPIGYSMKKEQILFWYNYKKFVWFDVKTQSTKIVQIDGMRDIYGSRVLPASLVRLNRNGGATRSFTLRMTREMKRKMADRLQLTLTSIDLQLPFRKG